MVNSSAKLGRSDGEQLGEMYMFTTKICLYLGRHLTVMQSMKSFEKEKQTLLETDHLEWIKIATPPPFFLIQHIRSCGNKIKSFSVRRWHSG
uniref:Uncharacterized protein n=1 Tax=Trichobilharzia regenti TaxID=157069 RepID=A0AA85J403_TRIRE|nr:unnamed protein product [Trichobilharzia regenti]